MLIIVLFFVTFCNVDADTTLSCYHCTNITHTYDCGTLDKCSGAYEACYIESLYEGNNRMTYTQGCIPTHLCEENPVSSIIGRSIHRRQELGEFQCCFTNQCNQHHVAEVEGLVFRITPHIGGDVLQAWLKGTLTISEDYCRNIHPFGCGIHYRNNAIDNWENLNITVVKYALYVKEQEVACIYFNGTGSNMTNWFSQDRVINSTWVDLKNTTFNAFGIEVTYPPNRRFYINKEWGGCGNDRGWTIVVSGHHVCNFDNKNIPYPYILYAKGNTYGHYFESYQFGQADVAAVYIYHN